MEWNKMMVFLWGRKAVQKKGVESQQTQPPSASCKRRGAVLGCHRRASYLKVGFETWGPFLESPEKLFVKLRSANSVKPFFSHFEKGIKIKIYAKFRASRRLRFEDTKRIMSPEIRPTGFGTFEKRAPGPGITLSPWEGNFTLRRLSPPRCINAYRQHTSWG